MQRTLGAMLILAFAYTGCGDSKDTGAPAGSGGDAGSGASGSCYLDSAWCNGACVRQGQEAGGCKVLSTNTTFALAMGEGNLYYANPASVGRFDLGSLEWMDLATGFSSADELLYADGTLFFDTFTSEAALGGASTDGTVRSLPATGGTPTLLTRVNQGPSGLARAGAALYFGLGAVGNYELMELPAAGGTAVNALLYSDITAFAIDGTTRFFARASDLNNQKLRTTPLSDPRQETVVAELGAEVDSFVTDSSYVYFTGFVTVADPVPGVLGRVPKAGGTVEPLATGHVSYYIKLVEADSVYALEVGASIADGSRLLRIPLDGSAPTTIATFRDPHDLPIAADAQYFYVATVSSTGLLRILR